MTTRKCILDKSTPAPNSRGVSSNIARIKHREKVVGRVLSGFGHG